jgi:IS5 family transposase
VDVKRAADLYAQGRTLRQIGAELGVPWTAVGYQLRRAGVTMRRGAPPGLSRLHSADLGAARPRPDLD